MALLVRLGAWFRTRFGASDADTEFDAELNAHVSLLTQRYIRQGMTPDAARRAARLQFGNITLLREERRFMQTLPPLESLWRDVCHAVRVCRRTPSFTAAVVLTLALGIGANTAIFTICNAILLKPLPYSDPDQLVMLWERLPHVSTNITVAPANFVDWRAQTRSFSAVAAINPFLNFVLTGSGEPQRLTAAAVSSNFFALLGTDLSTGRSFLPEEDVPGQNRVAILSHSTWTNRFGARTDIVGHAITLNDVSFTVVGVLPNDFELVTKATDFPGQRQFNVWIPLALRQNPSRGTHPLRVFARLKPDTTLDQAQANLDVVAADLARAYPEDNTDRTITAVPLFQQVTNDVRPALLTLLGSVGFVLLIACANVANLLLSRGAARQREMSVRLAIGAGLRRVAQQLLVESAVLAVAGGSLGLALAVAAIRIAAPYLPADVSRAAVVGIDPRVLIFTSVVSLTTGMLFGLAPLFQARRVNPSDALTQGTRVTSGGQSTLRSTLVVSQIAVTLVLLIGAALMARSLWTLTHVPPGFRADHVLTARLTLPRLRYADAGRIAAFQRELLAELRETTGVQAAGFAAYLPFSGDDNGWAFFIEGRPPLPTGVYNVVNYRPVSDGYFETLGMPLIQGRDFTSAEDQDSPFVAVINESMARAYWGADNPVGQRLRFGGPEWRTIVGVVGDVRHERLDRESKAEMYVPFAQAPQPESASTLVVRTAIDAAAMTTAMRSAVSQMDAALPLDRVRTMEQLVSASVGEPRFQSIVLVSLALLAMAMASVGIYGVTNYRVVQRTREFGIRLALGATAGTVRRRVLGQAGQLILVGLGLGLLASVGLTRLIAGFLYGVTPLDPLTFVVVPVFLFGVATVATYLPARRATRVDPIVALRWE